MGRFYKNKLLSSNEYSKRKALVSITLGLLSMFLFYFFQQYLFVLFRSALLAFEFNVNHILSEEIGSFISYIFAGNAVIIGNSVGISFYISGVSKTIKKRFRKRDVLNNQSFVIGSYFFWFFKIAVLMGSLPTILLITGLFEYISKIYILLFIVLFLESVKELRRSFDGYSLRKLVFHFLLVIGLGAMLTLINTSSYYRLGYKYDTLLPYVEIPSTSYQMSDYDDLILNPGHYPYHKTHVKVKLVRDRLAFNIYGENVKMIELVSTVRERRIREELTHVLMIYADKSLPYYKLVDIEYEAIKEEMYNIEYAIYSTLMEEGYSYRKRLYPSKDFYAKMNYNVSPPPSIEYILKDKKEISIVLDTFTTQNQIDTKKVYEYFQESVSDSTFFNLKINKEVTLQEYLDFMISYKQSVYDLRDEQKRMNNALNDYKINEREKYPFNIIEEIEE